MNNMNSSEKMKKAIGLYNRKKYLAAYGYFIKLVSLSKREISDKEKAECYYYLWLIDITNDIKIDDSCDYFYQKANKLCCMVLYQHFLWYNYGYKVNKNVELAKKIYDVSTLSLNDDKLSIISHYTKNFTYNYFMLNECYNLRDYLKPRREYMFELAKLAYEGIRLNDSYINAYEDVAMGLFKEYAIIRPTKISDIINYLEQKEDYKNAYEIITTSDKIDKCLKYKKLGEYYLDGLGVEKDLVKASLYFKELFDYQFENSKLPEFPCNDKKLAYNELLKRNYNRSNFEIGKVFYYEQDSDIKKNISDIYMQKYLGHNCYTSLNDRIIKLGNYYYNHSEKEKAIKYYEMALDNNCFDVLEKLRKTKEEVFVDNNEQLFYNVAKKVNNLSNKGILVSQKKG